ncbi:MAG: hypothetical protein ABFR50_11665 [Candidatus Fermentibacteria bacterium]
MKCPNCAAQIGNIDRETYTCKYCQSTFHASEFDPDWNNNQDTSGVKEIHHYHHPETQDKLSVGMGCLSFLFFPIGWIIYFLYRDSSPRKAKVAMIIAAVMTVFFLVGIASGTGVNK